jgi:hypothetical protein
VWLLVMSREVSVAVNRLAAALRFSLVLNHRADMFGTPAIFRSTVTRSTSSASASATYAASYGPMLCRSSQMRGQERDVVEPADAHRCEEPECALCLVGRQLAASDESAQC